MRQRYWNKMTQMKFHLIYLGYHYHESVNRERIINTILAIISTGSLAGLFFVPQHQWVLSVVLGLAQVVSAAKPCLPYASRVADLDKGLVALNVIYENVEKQWKKVDLNEMSEDEINDSLYSFQKQWEEVDGSILKGDSLSRKQKYIDMADNEKNQYFDNMFGGYYE